jgi:hypothetical protein
MSWRFLFMAMVMELQKRGSAFSLLVGSYEASRLLESSRSLSCSIKVCLAKERRESGCAGWGMTLLMRGKQHRSRKEKQEPSLTKKQKQLWYGSQRKCQSMESVQLPWVLCQLEGQGNWMTGFVSGKREEEEREREKERERRGREKKGERKRERRKETDRD